MKAWWRRGLRGLIAGLSVFLLALPACRDPRELEAPPVLGASRQYAGSELTYFGLAPELRTRHEKLLMAEFEEATGITVTTIPLPDNSEEAYLVLQRLAAEGRVDVLTLDVIWTAAFAQRLVDLGPVFGEAAKAHFPAYLATGTHDGKLVGMPMYATVGTLFSRTDLLAAYGYADPPTTWEELETMSREIQAGERQKQPGFAGFVWPGSSLEALTCFGLELQWSHGAGSFIDEQTRKGNVATPRAIAAYRRAQDWVGTISPSSVTSYTTPDAQYVFRQGMAAFLRDWATAYAVCNSPRSPIRGKFTISELPHAEGAYPPVGTLGGWMLGVSRQAKDPDAANLFVGYMTSPEVQAWRARLNGTPPTLPALYRDAVILEAQPQLAQVAPIVQRAIARPSGITGSRYKAVSQVYYQGLNAILRGSRAEGVAPLMQRDLTDLLAR